MSTANMILIVNVNMYSLKQLKSGACRGMVFDGAVARTLSGPVVTSTLSAPGVTSSLSTPVSEKIGIYLGRKEKIRAREK